jgi:hypothetical protein
MNGEFPPASNETLKKHLLVSIEKLPNGCILLDGGRRHPVQYLGYPS